MLLALALMLLLLLLLVPLVPAAPPPDPADGERDGEGIAFLMFASTLIKLLLLWDTPPPPPPEGEGTDAGGDGRRCTDSDALCWGEVGGGVGFEEAPPVVSPLPPNALALPTAPSRVLFNVLFVAVVLVLAVKAEADPFVARRYLLPLPPRALALAAAAKAPAVRPELLLMPAPADEALGIAPLTPPLLFTEAA